MNVNPGSTIAARIFKNDPEDINQNVTLSLK
jgi:hypothetical protein